MEVKLIIDSCNDCPFKTEYSDNPDYWGCDQVGKVIHDLNIIMTGARLRRMPMTDKFPDVIYLRKLINSNCLGSCWCEDGGDVKYRRDDIAKEQGRREMKAEIVKWLVKNAVGKWKVSLVDAANQINKEF